MEIEKIKNYKTVVGVGTNEETLQRKAETEFAYDVEDKISEKMEDEVKESDELEEAIKSTAYNDLYGDYASTEGTEYNNQLSGIYFPSEFLKRDATVKKENGVDNTIYRFSPIVMQCKNKDENRETNDTYFINLGPDITIYKADNEDTEKMQRIISVSDEYETPYLNFFVDDVNYNISSKERETQMDVDDFQKNGTFEAKLENFYAKIGMIIPIEKNLEAILDDSFTKEAFLEKANLDLDLLTGENTKIFIDNKEVIFDRNAEILPLNVLISNINQYRLNAKSISKMEEIKKTLENEKIDYNKEVFEKNFAKLLNASINYDLSLNSYAEDKMFDINSYREDLQIEPIDISSTEEFEIN